MAEPRVPLSCYRLQLNRNFTFRDASAALGYLAKLGITDIYASPILRSRSGSGHGYDVTDPTRIDIELGGEDQFDDFHKALRKHDMGLLLDIVPNHMAASHENPWWMDVLENGPGSAYAAYFDIDWHPPSRNLDGRILLPILGSHYGDTLKNQELRVVFQDGSFLLQYHESLLPLAPKTYRRILKHRQDALERRLGAHSPALLEFLGIVAAVGALPEREALTADAAGERRLQVEAIKERLRGLHHTSREFRDVLSDNLKQFNGARNDAGSFRLLDRLLSEQAYVLTYWQNVNEAINYRRFFAITDLVGVRVEDPMVFEAMHGVIFHLIEKGAVTGLRLDHIDGLRDPLGYLRRLRERINGSQSNSHAVAQANEGAGGFYIIVEKILSRGEALPSDWPVQGTTGYEYMNAVNRLFVHPAGAKAIQKIYTRFVARQFNYEEVVSQKKKLVMSTLLAVEMRALGRQLAVLAGQDRYARDLPRADLAQALEETTSSLSVYRTYTRSMELCGETKRYIESAVAAARKRRPHLDAACFDFVEDVLLLRDADHLFPEQREARLSFVMRWQQFTGPIVAKGLEDTALYVYCPLISLNEVGGDARPSTSAAQPFEEFIEKRQLHWSHTLNATSTHDTKRGEDARARINVLSEIPSAWQKRLDDWARWNESRRKLVDRHPVPDRNEEIFLYQTLLGAWPFAESPFDGGKESKQIADFRDRLNAYIVKATREAMVHTRWTRPNVAHERALVDFTSAILKPGRGNRFLPDFLEFQKQVAFFGMLNSLSQVLLKITNPGVPDFYQGCDLWDFHFVDPDNRGAVDFAKRAELLEDLMRQGQGHPSTLLADIGGHWQDGRIKLYLIWKALAFRRRHPELFLNGQFFSARAEGARGGNVLVQGRREENTWVMALAPRWLARARAAASWSGLQKFWRGSHVGLPEGAPERWCSLLTGESFTVARARGRAVLPLEDVFGKFPVALLAGSGTLPGRAAAHSQATRTE